MTMARTMVINSTYLQRKSPNALLALLASATLAGCTFATPNTTPLNEVGVLVDITKLYEIFDIPYDNQSTLIAQKYPPSDTVTLSNTEQASHKPEVLSPTPSETASAQIDEQILEVSTTSIQTSSEPTEELSDTTGLITASRTNNGEEKSWEPIIIARYGSDDSSHLNYGNNTITEIIQANLLDDTSQLQDGIVTASTKASEGEFETAALTEQPRKVAPSRQKTNRAQILSSVEDLPVEDSPSAAKVKQSNNGQSRITARPRVPSPPRLDRARMSTQSGQRPKSVAALPSQISAKMLAFSAPLPRGYTVAKQAPDTRSKKESSTNSPLLASITSTPFPILPDGTLYVGHLPDTRIIASEETLKNDATSASIDIQTASPKVTVVEGSEAPTTKATVLADLKPDTTASDQATKESNALLLQASALTQSVSENDDDPFATTPSEFAPSVTTADARFIAPVAGKIVANFGFNRNGWHNDGINIAAEAGTSVLAADDGVVIYAGDDIAGFGNLILVRHSDNFVSAYAHAAELRVNKGEQVKRGEVIATVGNTGSVNYPQLHFEIRRGTQPINPTKYL